MESVIYSISFGKSTTNKKIQYQAFSAAISQQMHVEMVMQFVNRRQKIKDAKTAIVAYRLGKSDGPQSEMSMNHSQSRHSLKSQHGDDGVIEGFDDGNEEGSGEKMLA